MIVLVRVESPALLKEGLKPSAFKQKGAFRENNGRPQGSRFILQKSENARAKRFPSSSETVWRFLPGMRGLLSCTSA